ncbi:leukosialin-like [Erythrolamprus reginae]|uniref:leukosialin-like n=1 Tax=Erythrolamprus reginae TaxID=121349 RepID=UPI00396CE5BF
MEKSRSLFQHVTGHKMLFVVFLLFPTNILAENAANVTTSVETAAKENIINSTYPASSKTNANISTTSLSDATTPTILSRILSTSKQPSVSLETAPPVSKQELQSVNAANQTVQEDTSPTVPSKDTVSTEKHHPHTEAAEAQGSKLPPVQKEVPSGTTATPLLDSETVSSPTEDLGTRSQKRFSEQSSSAVAHLGTTKSTEQKEGNLPPHQAVPGLTQTTETATHYTYTKGTPNGLSDKSSSGKTLVIIIVVIVLAILLFVVLLLVLYLRRRRHSGSTSFNSPEWAGQATLPDDTGLDKDVEQQAGSVGEGETRRGTLVTFFGKRQSRVPSVAMEDVNGKGSKEESEQLLSEKVETRSPSEAVGDANGKVSEPLKGSPQRSPDSNQQGESSS